MIRSEIGELDGLVSDLHRSILIEGFGRNGSARISAGDSLNQDGCFSMGDEVNGGIAVIVVTAAEDTGAADMVIVSMAVDELANGLICDVADGIFKVDVKCRRTINDNDTFI